MWNIFHQHSFYLFDHDVNYLDVIIEVELCKSENCNKFNTIVRLQNNYSRHSKTQLEPFENMNVSHDILNAKAKILEEKQVFWDKQHLENNKRKKLKRLISGKVNKIDHEFCQNCGVKQI